MAAVYGKKETVEGVLNRPGTPVMGKDDED